MIQKLEQISRTKRQNFHFYIVCHRGCTTMLSSQTYITNPPLSIRKRHTLCNANPKT
uniref:Uncharacterized protein n=1 Tax=Rhizophora mucronata TaxID=61149 RepID=A0A2P2NSF5_RHIMU